MEGSGDEREELWTLCKEETRLLKAVEEARASVKSLSAQLSAARGAKGSLEAELAGVQRRRLALVGDAVPAPLLAPLAQPRRRRRSGAGPSGPPLFRCPPRRPPVTQRKGTIVCSGGRSAIADVPGRPPERQQPRRKAPPARQRSQPHINYAPIFCMDFGSVMLLKQGHIWAEFCKCVFGSEATIW